MFGHKNKIKAFLISTVTALLGFGLVAPANAVVTAPTGEELRAFTFTSQAPTSNGVQYNAYDFKISETTAAPSGHVSEVRTGPTPSNDFTQYATDEARSATYDPITKSAYIYSGNRNQYGALTKVDFSGASPKIDFMYKLSSKNPTLSNVSQIQFIAVDKQGNAYMAGRASGSHSSPNHSLIWKIDLATGLLSNEAVIDLFNGSQMTPSDLTGFAYNPSNNKFYISDGNEQGKLFEVNVSTGLTTSIGESKQYINSNSSGPYAIRYDNYSFSFDTAGNFYKFIGEWNDSLLYKSPISTWTSTAFETVSYTPSLPLNYLQYAVTYVKYEVAGSGGGNSGGGTGGGNSGGGTGSSGSGTTGGTTSSLAAGEQSALGAIAPTSAPAQGTSTSTVGGNSVRTNTASNSSNETVTTSNGGTYASSLTFKDLDGNSPVPLTTNDTIGAEPGSDLSVTGRGFRGRTQVQVYLIDSSGASTYLGKINTSLFGRVKGKLNVPTSLKSGKYTLQVNGFTSKKQLVKSTNLGMEVVQDDLGSLYFNSDSSVATDETKVTIKEMAKSLDAGETVILYGYTSGNPESAYRAANYALAKRRTNTIKALFDAEGVKSTIVIEPRGAVSPYGAGGHSKNRRVDVKPTN